MTNLDEMNNKIDAMEKTVTRKMDLMQLEVSKISEAIIQIVKLQEQVSQGRKEADGLGARLTKVEDEVKDVKVTTIPRINQDMSSIKTQVETSKATNKIYNSWIERFIWFIVAAAFAAYNFFKV